MTAAEGQARTDVGALAVERERRLAAFNAKPGWRVVVETSGGEPPWPQGFDPTKVETVGAERVLHARYLKLGNAAGQLEALDAESLTNGSGAHPLYKGVRRVEFTGLAKSEVTESEGKFVVRAPGLTLEFKGASLVRTGDE